MGLSTRDRYHTAKFIYKICLPVHLTKRPCQTKSSQTAFRSISAITHRKAVTSLEPHLLHHAISQPSTHQHYCQPSKVRQQRRFRGLRWSLRPPRLSKQLLAGTRRKTMADSHPSLPQRCCYDSPFRGIR